MLNAQLGFAAQTILISVLCSPYYLVLPVVCPGLKDVSGLSLYGISSPWEGVSQILSETGSRSVVSDSLRPHGLCSPWSSPGQHTGVGSLSLLQGTFPAQGSSRALLRCRRILYQLSYGASTCIKGSVRNYWTSELLGILVVPFFKSLFLVEDNCFTILDWLLLWQKCSLT